MGRTTPSPLLPLSTLWWWSIVIIYCFVPSLTSRSRTTPLPKRDVHTSDEKKIITSELSCQNKYPIPRPLVSVVFTAQGGTFGESNASTSKHEIDRKGERNTYRFLRQIWWLSEVSKRTNVSLEIVVVDWPVRKDTPLRERILSAIAREKEKITESVEQLRIIELPRQEFSNLPSGLPILEYYGKNIGVRRAFGRYILLGGTDSLPHEGIFRYLASVDGLSGCYGAFRQKLGSGGGSFPRPPYDYNQYIQWRDDPQNIKKWVTTGGNGEIIFNPQVQPHPIVSPRPRWNAAGDFTLCTRPAFARVGGYIEEPYRYHVDSALLRFLAHCKIKLQIFHPTLSVFHQSHQLTVQERFPYPFQSVRSCPSNPSQVWGLPTRHLGEHVFSKGTKITYHLECIPPFEALKGEKDG